MKNRSVVVASVAAALCGMSIVGVAHAAVLQPADDPLASSPPISPSAAPTPYATPSLTSTPATPATPPDSPDLEDVEKTAQAAMTSEIKAAATDSNVADTSDSTQATHATSAPEEDQRLALLSKFETSTLATTQRAALDPTFAENLAISSDTVQDAIVFTDGSFVVERFSEESVSGDTATLVMQGHANYASVNGDTRSGSSTTYSVSLVRAPDAAFGWLVDQKTGTLTEDGDGNE